MNNWSIPYKDINCILYYLWLWYKNVTLSGLVTVKYLTYHNFTLSGFYFHKLFYKFKFYTFIVLYYLVITSISLYLVKGINKLLHSITSFISKNIIPVLQKMLTGWNDYRINIKFGEPLSVKLIIFQNLVYQKKSFQLCRNPNRMKWLSN